MAIFYSEIIKRYLSHSRSENVEGGRQRAGDCGGYFLSCLDFSRDQQI